MTRLDPVMWPAPAGEHAAASGVSSAPAASSPPITARVSSHRSRLGRVTATSDAFPLRLNTGRVRDQWHTMTRTGTSPRLCAHSPQPFIEIHPADAEAAGLVDGGFATVTTQYGSAILKVSCHAGQRRGSIFAPIHWSDATAAHARVGDLAAAARDPVSGQPELKATPARVAPVKFAYRGFALTRRSIVAAGGDVVCPAGCCRW